MNITSTISGDFKKLLSGILKRGSADSASVEAPVRNILDNVKRNGDRAVIRLTRKFDGVDLKSGFQATDEEIEGALRSVPKKDLAILRLSCRRIKEFHKRQIKKSWSIKDSLGNTLGVRITPVERAGIYCPGGKASYPSTVLMNAVPARVAGVKEVYMATPPSRQGISPYVLAAASIAGIDRVYKMGGAQAIGAFAYGTETVKKVDKITGPGNIYVSTAKRLVYGAVGIDMIAGPSEILIINDGAGDPRWIALDLLSQAEHDELASSLLITTSRAMAEKVSLCVQDEIKRLEKPYARKSIADYGLIIIAKDLKEACAISNEVAPEHLELFVKEPKKLLGHIRNAGCIFLGSHTPEATGDYLAGPNHTLPTGGTARFSSPLGVYDFMKSTSIVGFSEKGIKALGNEISRFAEIEGLQAHAKSAGARITE